MGDHFCLKWNSHQENITESMIKLLENQKFVDVTLVCEMKTFSAHQTVLSACSPYFEQVLQENPHPHPTIILIDVRENQMKALLNYMYRGEVSVRDDELPDFLHTARALKIRGLSENLTESERQSKEEIPLAQIETYKTPKRLKTSLKIHEQDALELSESQVVNQDEGNIPASNENSSSGPQMGTLDTKPEQYHRLGERSFDYGGVDNKNYQIQQVELPKVPIPMTYNFSTQLQGSSIPGLYPCNSKAKSKKEQPSTSYEGRPKTEFSLGSTFALNHPVSVIKNAETSETNSQSSGKKGGRFRPGWMENYSWLQYDECLNTMYCKTCRKWSSSVPDIRTSFVEGNGNFRLEIVNHHHKSKAHKLCMAKEEESIPRLDPIMNEDNN